MGAWNNFVNWLKEYSEDPDDTYYVESQSGFGISDAENTLNLKLLMMNSALGYLATGLSMCRWRIMKNGEEVEDEEFFRLNNCPNRSQNKQQFCNQLLYELAFHNEALIVSPRPSDHGLWIAKSWDVVDKGTKGIQYRNVYIENEDRSYNLGADQVMHIQLNWVGMQGLLQQIAAEYESMIATAVTGYTKQAGERGILQISGVPSGTKEQQQAFMKSLEERFQKYFKSYNAVLPLQSGYSYSMNATAHRNTSEINDVINLTDEFAERVALALRIPVALLKGNVENTQHARTDLVLYGIKPIATQIEQEYNAKRLGTNAMKRGCRLYIDPISIHMANLEDMAAFCEKMTSCGQYSIDELRHLRGEPLLGTEEAQAHWMTKNYGTLEQAESVFEDTTTVETVVETEETAEQPALEDITENERGENDDDSL